jgi:hypothetical protein
MLSHPRHPRDQVSGWGLAITTAVGCLVLLLSFFQFGLQPLGIGLLAAIGIVGWLVVRQHPTAPSFVPLRAGPSRNSGALRRRAATRRQSSAPAVRY